MKFLTYRRCDEECVGLLNTTESWVYPISASGFSPKTMLDLIASADDGVFASLRELAAKTPGEVAGAVPLEETELLAPIPVPKQDFLCLGVNYADHAEESARFHRERFQKDSERQTVYFSKRVNRAVPPFGGICAHENVTSQLDYEAELVVVLKKDARNVRRGEARNYIFGYTIMNDVSARDVQTAHKQFYFGKSLDGFTPLGPWIVTEDEIPYPPELAISSLVNGELRQDSNTRMFLSTIEDVIVELTQAMTLQAGTMLATGTPAGVGMGFSPPKFLKIGDTVECRIEGIGSLRNMVVSSSNKD